MPIPRSQATSVSWRGSHGASYGSGPWIPQTSSSSLPFAIPIEPFTQRSAVFPTRFSANVSAGIRPICCDNLYTESHLIWFSAGRVLKKDVFLHRCSCSPSSLSRKEARMPLNAQRQISSTRRDSATEHLLEQSLRTTRGLIHPSIHPSYCVSCQSPIYHANGVTGIIL